MIEAVEQILGQLGDGVLGTNEELGIIVGNPQEVKPSEIEEFFTFYPDSKVIYVLIIFIRRNSADSTRVEIMTIFREVNEEKGLVHENSYSSGNSITERLFTELEKRFGPNLMVPWLEYKAQS